MASVMPAGACTGTVPLSAVVLLDRTQVGNLWNRSIVLGRVHRAAVQHAPYLISFPKTRQWLSALLGDGRAQHLDRLFWQLRNDSRQKQFFSQLAP